VAGRGRDQMAVHCARIAFVMGGKKAVKILDFVKSEANVHQSLVGGEMGDRLDPVPTRAEHLQPGGQVAHVTEIVASQTELPQVVEALEGGVQRLDVGPLAAEVLEGVVEEAPCWAGRNHPVLQ